MKNNIFFVENQSRHAHYPDLSETGKLTTHRRFGYISLGCLALLPRTHFILLCFKDLAEISVLFIQAATFTSPNFHGTQYICK